MRLTPRWRIVLLLALACVVGFWYFTWALHTGRNVVRQARFGVVICSNSFWQDFGNGECGSSLFGTGYSPVEGVLELVVVSIVLIVLGWLLARWALRPVRAMTDTVSRFGPTSLGLRLNASGPRDETRRLADAIDAMLARVAEGYEAQRRFASNASHELRTPLATQRALIEVSLAGGALTDEQLELLTRQLLATNERNEKLVEGLLVLAETERGMASSGPQRLDELVSDAAEQLRNAAERNQVALTLDTQPVTVVGEEPLLERLAVNLISNAIKYNAPDGWVRVSTQEPGSLTVVNTGPVVDPDQVPSLFEPFRRQAGDRLDHGGGVGLGLTIVRSIVAAHGGSVQAQANPDGGLTVEVRLRPAT
ncbi:MAG TPA: HAMP domain-containing sensor histidine kinase [Jatrophihabitantaceae bacterium]|jgi:signal transduction histidine kinase|nr:HAMP domain-containing sensor histidine kinase [Jatrophihabitantaceae bacterium]